MQNWASINKFKKKNGSFIAMLWKAPYDNFKFILRNFTFYKKQFH